MVQRCLQPTIRVIIKAQLRQQIGKLLEDILMQVILYFDGKLDQARIFNTAISAANVTDLARGAGSAFNAADSNVTYSSGYIGNAGVFNGSTSKFNLPSIFLLTVPHLQPLLVGLIQVILVLIWVLF